MYKFPFYFVLITSLLIGCQVAETTEEETPVGETVEIPQKRGAASAAEIAGNLLLYMDGSQSFDDLEPYILNPGQLEAYYRATGQHEEQYLELFYQTRHRVIKDTLKFQLLNAKQAIEWAEIDLGTVTDTVIFRDSRYYMQVRMPLRYFQQPYLFSAICVSHSDSLYLYKDIELEMQFPGS